MLGALRSRAALRRKAGEIYGAIVTQARREEFYAKLGIPDTPAGRYDMVVLHLFLVLERLRMEATRSDTLQRLLIEAFVADMDDSLRELGTGDVVVGKKVRRAAAGFYERARGYREALADGDARALEQVLVRHGLARAGERHGSRALGAYIQAAAAALKGQDGDEVLAGRLAFPHQPSLAEDRR
jgi:cytochrome b pre-mRNA-processing protein 3